MATLLFPGRHVVNTRFQEEYLLRHLRVPIAGMTALLGDTQGLDLVGRLDDSHATLDRVVFAITSANQSHSRYNPVPLEVRGIGVDRFARRLAEALDVRYRILPVPHFGPTPRFAEFILKEIAEQTEQDLWLTPVDTVVYTATPEVARQFLAMGFAVLPGEMTRLGSGPEPCVFGEATPAEVLRRLVSAGEGWAADGPIRRLLSPATFSVWRDFPDVPRRVLRLFRDPLLTDSGSLTATRNYGVYSVAMNNAAILEMKYRDIRDFIRPGKIADEGCADGAMLVPVARDFPDSDLIGIEITGEFLARCHERQRALEFGGSYVHFHQRNLAEPIFEDGSIDTTICNSTTHELWSYARGESTLREYLRRKCRQTRRGGRVVIRDVVGPEGRDEEVWLWCDETDGAAGLDPLAEFATPGELAEHLGRLSTAGRFRRFARDYLASMRRAGRRRPEEGVRYREAEAGGKRFFVLRLAEAVEFLMKKDYLDNWASEMNEEFTFWSFGDWKRELRSAGFAVVEDPNEPARGSRAYANEWIVKNRWEAKVRLYRPTAAGPEPAAWPVTNMVLVGEQRE